MTKEELENEMLGDVVCSLENFQFAIYTGLKGPGSITATTDIYGKYKDSAQEFKDMDDLWKKSCHGFFSCKKYLWPPFLSCY